MIHGVKVDNGDGSSSILWFSTQQLAYKYIRNNEAWCFDGDGETYFQEDLIPGPTFTFDDDAATELDN